MKFKVGQKVVIVDEQVLIDTQGIFGDVTEFATISEIPNKETFYLRLSNGQGWYVNSRTVKQYNPDCFIVNEAVNQPELGDD